MKPWKAFRSSILRWCSAAILAFGVLCAASAPASAEVGISFGVFYDSLAPYGDWVYLGHYGRVWRPRVSVVGIDFRPYVTGGHWVYTDYGWSFESDYEWGWAPFHYGRWLPDPAFGWVWVPGTDWAPAWVDWRYADGYIGWAPLAPVGANIVIENYDPAWCFVPTRHFLERDFYHHAEAPEWIHVHFGATVPIHNEVAYGGARWYAGPPAGHVAAAVGLPIHPVAVVPPQPGAVQPVRAGVPTVVSAPVGRTVGTPTMPSPPASIRGGAPSWSQPLGPAAPQPSRNAAAPNSAGASAPNWSAGRAVNLPAPVAGTYTQAPPAAQVPRRQPGWGARPAPSEILTPAGHPTPQSAAPQVHTSQANAGFVAPAPQPRSTFVQPRAPMASAGVHAPAATVAGRAEPPAVALAPARPAAPPVGRGIAVARVNVR